MVGKHGTLQHAIYVQCTCNIELGEQYSSANTFMIAYINYESWKP